MFCIKCGTKLADDARFCSNCGAKVAAPEEPAAPVKDEEVEIRTTSIPSFEKPQEAPKQDKSEADKDILSGFNISWETTDDEAPAKNAFDKRVSFDWTSVIDESHKREVRPIRSPWDPVPEEEKAAPVVEKMPSAPAEPAFAPRLDDELAKEFEGIDVTPTTEKGRTLTFIEILKKEREEKEKAEQAKVDELTRTEKPEDYSDFDAFSSSMTEIDALKARTKAVQSEPAEAPSVRISETEPQTETPVPAAEVEPKAMVITDFADLIENEPAPAPRSFVQPAESEMEDIKAAYDESKTELPSFEMPSFGFRDEVSKPAYGIEPQGYGSDSSEEPSELVIGDADDADEIESVYFEGKHSALKDDDSYEKAEELAAEPEQSIEDIYLSGSFSSDETAAESEPESVDAEVQKPAFSEEPVVEAALAASEEIAVSTIPAVEAEPAAEALTPAEPRSEAIEELGLEDELKELELTLAKEKDSAAKLEAELAAILASGNGFIPGVSSAEEREAEEAPSMPDLYEAADSVTPVQQEPVFEPEKTEDEPSAAPVETFESYEDGIDEILAEITAEDREENEFDFDKEYEDAATDEETEEYFADMIDSVVDSSSSKDEDALTLEDIFGNEFDKAPSAEDSAPEASAEPEPEVRTADPIESEIEALKRRLAELMSEKEEEVAVPANPEVPTIEDIFPEEDILSQTEPVRPDEEPVSSETDETPASVEAQTEPVVEISAPDEAENSADALGELLDFASRNEALDDIAHEAENAMSIEELEQELFGGDMQDEDGEMEATRKIDKFYTLYKKNEEFQKLLDDEYNRLQIEDDFPQELPSSMSDETMTQLSGLIIPVDEEPEAEEASAEAEAAASDDSIVKTEPDSKAARKEAKKAAKKAAKAAKQKELELEDEEEGGVALTIIAVVIAIILIFLLAAILILNFAPDSALGMKLDSIIQSISYFGSDISGDDGYLL